MNSYDENSLRKLSYSELRKCAKEKGIKVNVKAEKLIALLLDQVKADEDSFVTLERTIINSCKKNKEELFIKDKEIVNDTPRRETYTVDNPTIDLQAINASIVMASASPELKKSEKNEYFHVTLSRGSEKKSRKSKSKVSFVTPMRRSARISATTPQYNNVKDRPKTPMPTRLSSIAKDTSHNKIENSLACNLNFNSLECKTKSSSGGVKRPSTPIPQPKEKRIRLSSMGKSEKKLTSAEFNSTPKMIPALHQLKEEELNEASSSFKDLQKMTPLLSSCSSRKNDSAISGFKKSSTPMPAIKNALSSISKDAQKSTMPLSSRSSRQTGAMTPGFKKILTPLPDSKRTNTPNFSKIHQKAFEKMESIDDYQKRKVLNSAKKIKEQATVSDITKKFTSGKIKKMPKTFSGIPFVPTITSTRSMKTNFLMKSESKKVMPQSKPAALDVSVLNKKKKMTGNAKMVKSVSKENTVVKQKRKFDLRASLARKLPYKPHTGPLKQLSNVSLNNTFNVTALPSTKKTEVLKANRIQSRDVLRGVRKNKRFCLQMQNRQLNMTMQ